MCSITIGMLKCITICCLREKIATYHVLLQNKATSQRKIGEQLKNGTARSKLRFVFVRWAVSTAPIGSCKERNQIREQVHVFDCKSKSRQIVELRFCSQFGGRTKLPSSPATVMAHASSKKLLSPQPLIFIHFHQNILIRQNLSYQLTVCHSNLMIVGLTLTCSCDVVSAPNSVRYSNNMVPECNCSTALNQTSIGRAKTYIQGLLQFLS